MKYNNPCMDRISASMRAQPLASLHWQNSENRHLKDYIYNAVTSANIIT